MDQIIVLEILVAFSLLLGDHDVSRILTFFDGVLLIDIDFLIHDLLILFVSLNLCNSRMPKFSRLNQILTLLSLKSFLLCFLLLLKHSLSVELRFNALVLNLLIILL